MVTVQWDVLLTMVLKNDQWMWEITDSEVTYDEGLLQVRLALNSHMQLPNKENNIIKHTPQRNKCT